MVINTICKNSCGVRKKISSIEIPCINIITNIRDLTVTFLETAKILLDLGLYISFNGVITFKNAKKNVEVLKTIPLDRILVETDAPYLSPEPFRGKLNEPKNVNLVVDKISEILQVDRQELVNIFNANAMRLFKKLKF